jgi:hypothetical protein
MSATRQLDREARHYVFREHPPHRHRAERLVMARPSGGEKSHVHRPNWAGPQKLSAAFEAGRDGFWLHRLVTAHGVGVHVLERTNIPRPAELLVHVRVYSVAKPSVT